MDGQYAAIANDATNEASARAMTAWFDFLKDTRHWELEPYFDVDGADRTVRYDVLGPGSTRRTADAPWPSKTSSMWSISKSPGPSS